MAYKSTHIQARVNEVFGVVDGQSIPLSAKKEKLDELDKQATASTIGSIWAGHYRENLDVTDQSATRNDHKDACTSIIDTGTEILKLCERKDD
jgi:hypothetical protein